MVLCCPGIVVREADDCTSIMPSAAARLLLFILSGDLAAVIGDL